MSANWFYIFTIVALTAFCFWKPDFPKKTAPKFGIHGAGGLKIFLIFYWVMIPIIIHQLMSQIRLG